MNGEIRYDVGSVKISFELARPTSYDSSPGKLITLTMWDHEKDQTVAVDIDPEAFMRYLQLITGIRDEAIKAYQNDPNRY